MQQLRVVRAFRSTLEDLDGRSIRSSRSHQGGYRPMSVGDHPASSNNWANRQQSQNGAKRPAGQGRGSIASDNRRCRSEENVTLIDSEMTPLAVTVQSSNSSERTSPQRAESSNEMPTTIL